MRVLLVNKYFYDRGGAERAFFSMDRLLRANGHETVHFSMCHPMNHTTPWSRFFVSQVDLDAVGAKRRPAQALSRMFYSTEVSRAVRRLVSAARPDLAVLHNTYHQLGPSVITELHRLRIPMILMLHDFEVVCPAYRLPRDGGACGSCSGGAFYGAALHGCGRSSLESLLLSLKAYWQRSLLRVHPRVSTYAAPSRFLIEKIRSMGFPYETRFLRNFIEKVPSACDPARGEVIGYSGRLSQEKGVDVLIEAAAHLPHIPFSLAGEGPSGAQLRRLVHQKGLKNVHILGHLSPDDLVRRMRTWRVAVVPSVGVENCPFSVIEPLSMGIPVIGSNLGGIRELLQCGGELVPGGDARALARAIEEFWSVPSKARGAGDEGRRFIIEECSPRLYLERFRSIAQQAMGRAAG